MTRTLPAPPPRIARLPRNQAGYPIPWFVDRTTGPADDPDFRIADQRKLHGAITFRCCWICGGWLRNQTLGLAATQYAYVIGPMCAVNRISAEPPAHRDCAIYAATACPFLTIPHMRRRPDLPADVIKPDGEMLLRNPGVALVWVTNTWRMVPGHELWNVDEPAELLWFREGRPASRDDAFKALASGMPELRAAADKDPHPEAAHEQLDEQYIQALKLLPGTALG
ncbi:hypothetical protein ACIRJO_02695 [Streptomyces sp. NPDC102394]|uniref:hypothetical protein n=1 Tax=Streptomyces sp. NPDC102394 TaxID=3366167 RepID=UPI0038013793